MEPKSTPARFDYDKLRESQHFCMMPWIHFHIWPNGKVFPCCVADPSLPMGSTDSEKLSSIWNSERYKQLRLNMLRDTPSKECRRCYELEKSADVFTLRKNSIHSFSHLFSEIEQTREDGSLPDLKMAYMDIRFSNLCNFKCRTCGPVFSSSWAEEEAAGQGDAAKEKIVPLSLLNTPGFWQELEPLLPHVEEVYFAGGEALISPEHYRILKFWISQKLTNIRLRYTTNFSHFKFKSDDLLDLWSHFTDVRVAASLDAMGVRGEYLRKGTRWAVIENNRREMQRRCPHIYFEITPTISAYNIWHFPDFHRDWIEKGLIAPNQVRVNFLLDPREMRAQIIPKKGQAIVERKLNEHIRYLAALPFAREEERREIIEKIRSIIHFMSQEDLSSLIPAFIERNLQLDAIRGETRGDIFPEMRELGIL